MRTSAQPTHSDGRFVSLEKYEMVKREADLWDWTVRLFSNPGLPLSIKAHIWAERLEEDARAHKARDDGLVPLHLPSVAARLGGSADTVGKHLKRVAEEGDDILARAVVNKHEDGKISKRIFFRLSDLARRFPQRLRMKDGCESGHGGRRDRRELNLPPCTEPGCTCNVVVRVKDTQWVCEEHGVVIERKSNKKIILRAAPFDIDELDTVQLPIITLPVTPIPETLSDYALKRARKE